MEHLTEPWILWLIASIVLLILELLAPTMFLASLSAGAFASAIVTYYGFGLVIQGLVFTVVSLVLSFTVRPLFKDFLNKSQNGETNINKYIGKNVKVIKRISNAKETGRISIFDEEWTARSEDGTDFEVGTIVKVAKIESMIIYVSRIKE